MPQLCDECCNRLPLLAQTSIKPKALQNDGWLRIVVSLHQLHQLLVCARSWLLRCHKILNELICVQATTAQQDGPLLPHVRYIVHNKILFEPLRVGGPVLSRTVERAYAAVHGHSQSHPRRQHVVSCHL